MIRTISHNKCRTESHKWYPKRKENVRRFGYLTERARERKRHEVRDRIAELNISPEDKIVMLVIGTHGSSVGGETQLAFVGSISQEGVDAKFAETLGRIADFAASDMRIVLNSCSSLCGTDLESSRRAGQMLEFFGASDGIIYGAATSESFIDPNIIPSGKYLAIFAMGALAISETLLVGNAISDPIAFESLTNIEKITQFGGTFLTLLAAIPLIKWSFTDFWVRVNSKLRRLNFGRLFSFRNGALDDVEPVSKFFDRDKIYGNQTCVDALEAVSAQSLETQ